MAPQQEPGIACATRRPGESPGPAAHVQEFPEQHKHRIIDEAMPLAWLSTGSLIWHAS